MLQVRSPCVIDTRERDGMRWQGTLLELNLALNYLLIRDGEQASLFACLLMLESRRREEVE